MEEVRTLPLLNWVQIEGRSCSRAGAWWAGDECVSHFRSLKVIMVPRNLIDCTTFTAVLMSSGGCEGARSRKSMSISPTLQLIISAACHKGRFFIALDKMRGFPNQSSDLQHILPSLGKQKNGGRDKQQFPIYNRQRQGKLKFIKQHFKFISNDSTFSVISFLLCCPTLIPDCWFCPGCPTQKKPEKKVRMEADMMDIHPVI